MTEMTLTVSEISEPVAVRHRDLDRLTGWLQAMWHGEEARQGRDMSAGAVVLLPMFTWADDQGASGRKSQARNSDHAARGSRLLMPFRLVWDVPPVLLVPAGSTFTARWRATGPGYSAAGVLTITAADSPSADAAPVQACVPADRSEAEVLAPVLEAGRLSRELSALQDGGAQGQWELVEWITPQVTRLLVKAHSSMSKSLAEELGTAERCWLDEESLRQLSDVMLFGTGDREGSVNRWIALAMKPSAFDRCDPLRHQQVHLARDARQEVRACIGDPRAGSKIRQLARSMGTTDVRALVGEYRQRFPKDTVAAESVYKALNLAPDATAGSLWIGELSW